MRLYIRPQDDLLIRYSNALGALGEKQGHMALARAVNRTTQSVRSRVARVVAKQSSIPAKIVRKHIRTIEVEPGSGQRLEGVVRASGYPLSLKVFRAKQFKWGVRATIFGEKKRFEGAFIYAGTFRSGKYVGGGHVFQRNSARSLPIERLKGPAVPTEIVKDEAARIFEDTVEEMLPKRVAHEINRLLPG